MTVCLSLGERAAEFIKYKRDIGYVYSSQEKTLSRFIKYHDEQNGGTVLDKGTVLSYLENYEDSSGSLHNNISVIREFGLYLYTIGDFNSYLIPEKIGSEYIPKPPYFFTGKEISTFFEHIDSVLPDKGHRGRHLVIPAIFRLLYCCGLRCSEAIFLKVEDVHLSEKYIDIMQSKGPKDRRIFISEELSEYLASYDDQINLLFPNREYFFPNTSGHFKRSFLGNNFRRYWLEIYPDTSAENMPTAYDFRHHFAYSNINQWVTDGVDVNAKLPYLMRYMGHKQIKETLYYFHFVPEFFSVYREIAEKTAHIIPEVYNEK